MPPRSVTLLLALYEAMRVSATRRGTTGLVRSLLVDIQTSAASVRKCTSDTFDSNDLCG